MKNNIGLNLAGPLWQNVLKYTKSTNDTVNKKLICLL